MLTLPLHLYYTCLLVHFCIDNSSTVKQHQQRSSPSSSKPLVGVLKNYCASSISHPPQTSTSDTSLSSTSSSWATVPAARQQRSYSNPFDSVNEDSFSVASSNCSGSGNDALMTLQALAAAEFALVPTAATTTSSSSSSGSANTSGAAIKPHVAATTAEGTTTAAATAAAGTASSASVTTSSGDAPTVEVTSPTATVTTSTRNSVLSDTTVPKKSGHKRGTKSVAFADEAFHAAWNATEFSEWGSSAETGSPQTGSKTEPSADTTAAAVAGSDEQDQSNKFRSAVRHSVTWCDEAARQVAESAGRKLRRTMSDAK
jgi:hypothetical protein